MSYENLSMPASFPVVVRENRSLGTDFFLLDLESDSPVERAEPGQFLMLRGDWEQDPIGPRAFSILDQPDSRRILMLGRVVGRGTRLLAKTQPGDALSCVAPLGKSFPDPNRDSRVILVAGGVGLPPLYFFALRCSQGNNPVKTHLLYGAASACDLVLRPELSSLPLETEFATDDGTLGLKGLVTDLLATHLSSQEPPTLYACGPCAMLEVVQRLALAANAPAFLCMEELMACGFGACLGCAIPTHDPEVVRYCCVDGPVFDATEIALEPCTNRPQI